MYFTKEEIISFNKHLILVTGGVFFQASDNVRNNNSLEYLLTAPAQVVYGAESYPSIFDKAATYLFFIIKNHVFFDGNKRTGMMVTFMFLERNGYTVRGEVSQRRVKNYALRIARCTPTLPNVSSWLRRISIQR
jgi:death-on-curing protein